MSAEPNVPPPEPRAGVSIGRGRTLFLPVLVPGDGFAESEEQRLRSRYAVVSALLKSSYTPDNADRLHYRAVSPDCDAAASRSVCVPFETFSTTTTSGAKPATVCVLWLSDTHFGGARIYDKLRCVRSVFEVARPPSETQWTLIGPTSSDDLLQLFETDGTHNWISCVSPTATISTPTPPLLAASIQRPVVTDDLLAKALVTELGARLGPNADKRVNARIAVIYEADTAYGRTLAAEFQSLVQADAASAHPVLGGPVEVLRFPFFRGIDGMPPAQDQTRTARTEPAKPRDVLTRGRPAERPQGRAQLDYLRRLTEQIALMQEGTGRLEGGRLNQVRAIGIFGTDVFDKLLILQAMRARFPGVVFFTTDLDARLLMPDQFRWCRSLIVASGLGLSLGALQGETPPFRDCYQTSTYLAVQMAVDRRISPGPHLQPHIYEVGRHGPVDLTAVSNSQSSLYPTIRRSVAPPFLSMTQMFAALAIFCLFAMFMVIGHQTARARGFAVSPTRPSGLLAMGALLALGLTLFCLPRPGADILGIFPILGIAVALEKSWTPARFPWSAGLISVLNGDAVLTRLFRLLLAIVLSAVVIGLPMFLLITAVPTSAGGEPWSMTDGVSIWPTEVVRVIAALLSLYWCTRVLQDHARNEERLSRDFGFAPAPLATPQASPVAGTRCLWTFITRCYERWRDDVSIVSWRPPREPIHADSLWLEYQNRLKPGSQSLRVGFFTAGYVLFAYLIFTAIPMPMRPARGELAFRADLLLVITSSTVVAMLTFLVWDCTRLFDRFVRYLTSAQVTSYPPESLTQAHARTGVLASSWLDIQLIACRSDAISGSLYYPMMALFLLLVARSKLFDNWEWGLPLTLVHIATAAVAITSAWSLRNSARKARDVELARLERLEAELLAARPKSETVKADLDQVRSTINAVKAIQDGVFAPWRSHPIVGSVLIPAAGAGLLILIDVLQSWSATV